MEAAREDPWDPSQDLGGYSCDLNHKFAATEGLWFQFVNGKLMVLNSPAFA